jgi:hypothetical protein
MARINVFLAAELLRAVDTEAAEAGMRRSALIQAALTDYLEARRKTREEAAIGRRMNKACDAMDRVAEKLGAWDPAPLIRQFRDRQAYAVAETPAGRRGGKRS